MNKITRFRAYQLGIPGSSFSYSVDDHFTLIEARLTHMSIRGISAELELLNKNDINCLHITSWDQDHCDYDELSLILKYLKPWKIEYPGYAPHTDNAIKCKRLIEAYQGYTERISPDYINSLSPGEEKKYNNILYNPIYISDNSNDNSVVQLFRQGRFSLLSLGDCEDPAIARRLINSRMVNETDVLILAHHGADNGFTTRELIDAIQPKIAICSSNYDNQFEHPAQFIRDLLYYSGITLFTTKTGDIIIECKEDNIVRAYNLSADSTQISSVKNFVPKLLVNN